MTKVLKRQPRPSQKVEVISHAPNIDMPLDLPPKPEPRVKNPPIVNFDQFNLPRVTDEVQDVGPVQPTKKKVVTVASSGISREEINKFQKYVYNLIRQDFTLK